jgi:hypothetical protein
MFLVFLVVVVSANHLLIAKQFYSNGWVGDMFIDNAQGAATDIKRVIALDKNNVLSDAISDVVKGSACANLNSESLYSDEFKAYAANAMKTINSTLALRGLNAKQTSSTVKIDKFSAGCTVDISLSYTFVVYGARGGLQLTTQFTAKKQLKFTDGVGYTITDKSTSTDRADYP